MKNHQFWLTYSESFSLILAEFWLEFDLKYQIKNYLYKKFPYFGWILARIWLSQSLNFNLDVMIFLLLPKFENDHFSKGEQSFFFQINSKTLILRKKILNFIFSTTFLLINYRGIKCSFKNHIEKNSSLFS